MRTLNFIPASANLPVPLVAIIAMACTLAWTADGPLSAKDPPAKTAATSAPASQVGGAAPVYPLKVSDNKRFLVDQNNVPFLIAGDSPQALMSNLSEEQADLYFANRRSHGFNAAGWINVASERGVYPASRADGCTYDGIAPFTGFLPGGADFAHYDITKPNEAYFARLDRMIQLAAKHGIAVFLDPMETIAWLPTLRNNGAAACAAYGKYLGNRYKAYPNIAYLSGNDFDSWKKSPDDDALVRSVAMGIKSADPAHLQTVELLNDPSSKNPSWSPVISINLAYTYAATYIQMLECRNLTPPMPAFLGEAHYESEQVGNPTDFGTPAVVRRQAYWTMLSGGAGQFYGNAYTWTFKPGWEKNLDTPGAAQFTHWKRFFDSLPWQDLAPDQARTTVTDGLGTFGNGRTRVSQSDFCTAARTSDGAVAVAYMPTSRAITVNMAALKGPVNATWFDPSDGTYAPIAGSPFANAGTRQFTPPGKNHDGDGDWVLLLDARGGQGGVAPTSSLSSTKHSLAQTPPAGPVPLVLITDLYHSPGDPDDHIDLATVLAMPEFDVRAVLIDVRPPRPGDASPYDPGFIPICQLCYLTGKAFPIAVGPAGPLTSLTDSAIQRGESEQSAVRLLIKVLRDSREKVLLNTIGTCRILAAAFLREPALFREKVKAVVINAGSSQPGALEHNVQVDPMSYVIIMRSGLPILWFPCADSTTNWSLPEASGPNNTFYRLHQRDLYAGLPAPLRNWFAFALGRSNRADILRALAAPAGKETDALLDRGDRNLWSTASFVLTSGRVLAKTADGWRFVPKDQVPANALVAPLKLVPIDFSVTDKAQPSWSKAAGASSIQLFERAPGPQHTAAMGEALNALLKSFPLTQLAEKEGKEHS